eukprot:2173250-Rhodomonas_salina.2
MWEKAAAFSTENTQKQLYRIHQANTQNVTASTAYLAQMQIKLTPLCRLVAAPADVSTGHDMPYAWDDIGQARSQNKPRTRPSTTTFSRTAACCSFDFAAHLVSEAEDERHVAVPKRLAPVIILLHATE